MKVFFKENIADGPLGKTKYYAIGVEFQVRVSPCAQCALFSLGGQRTYFNFKQLGGVCRKKKKEKPELHELVKMYQLHRHSKICKRYNNEVVELNLKSFSIMKH